MEEKILFSEKQRFTQGWIWIVLVIVGLSQVGILVFLLISGNLNWIAMGGFVIFCLVIFLFTFCHLDTTIKRDGIHVRFFPFHFSERFYAWHQLTKCYVRKYRPIGEFGGWGIRGISRKWRAFNVSGNMGIQLEMQDGAKLLIGTNKPDEAREVLKRLGHLIEPINS